MATIKVLTSPSGQSVYAIDGERRSLLGYIGNGTFFSTRPEAEPYHRQRWGETLKRSIETAWIGKGIRNER